jgi:preprotein translocase subunit Sec63
VSVRQAIASNLAGNFVNHLSTQAQAELLQLRYIIQGIVLRTDTRLSPLSRSKEELDTSAIYKLLKARGYLLSLEEQNAASTLKRKNSVQSKPPP